ncbi:MAG: type IX secretion system sortase PorU [Bacteroidota bacterium]|nr:type IX secretion system sortase PorU [Bacteroidota bacterium]
MRRNWLLLAALGALAFRAEAQRVYRAGSVLASGTWYKIAVKEPGVYKVDLALFRALGANTSGLSSASIHLFGNGGQMLPEPCRGPRIDDLQENAIDMEDGGDGLFNGGDYFLFYAPGPHAWIKDSVNRQFTHRKNLYSEESFYFIQIAPAGGAARRIANGGAASSPNVFVNSFDERQFYELDSVNFLSSGKDWYGEEFSNVPGGLTTRSFPFFLPHLDSTQPLSVTVDAMARSINTGSRFTVGIGGAPVITLDIPPTSDGNYDVFGKVIQSKGTCLAAQSNFSLVVNFTPGSFNAQGWLNWIEVTGRGLLSLGGIAQLPFRDWNSVGAGHVAGFTLTGAGGGVRVWDVTDPSGPVNMQGALGGNNFSFANEASTLHEYIAFASGGWLNPLALGRVDNQNLHLAVSPSPQLLIITAPSLLAQAQRLAPFHQQQDPAHLRTLVVTTAQIYNEFASGSPDPTALRDYVKMFYDRSAGDSTKRPRYLLLFGAGSFDYKDHLVNNTNLVPAYESAASLDPLTTYCSDDFYGMLEDGEDVNNINAVNLLDIGIGRIPARNPAEATSVVNKVIHYLDPVTQGPWRNEINLIADDGDQNLHLTDAEAFSSTIGAIAPAWNLEKIYLDAYPEQNTPAGGRYPLVNQTISSQLYNGTLIWNYTGHGSSTRLSNEDILDQGVINGFSNPDKLPLFITATCDFAPYDNPLVQSIGANLLLRPATGAIALMTTTRLVFAFSNKIINNNYLQTAFQPRADGSYLSLGDAERSAKNFTYQTQTDAVNNRKFTLIGDPALTLAFPRFRVQTLTINGKPVTPQNGNPPPPADTLKALASTTVGGQVTDNSGALMTGFTGTLYVTVYDKPRAVSTLANNPTSIKTNFQVQDNVLYKGKAQVTGGLFNFSFVVPRDINYQYGQGKISYYAGTGGPGGGSGGGGGGGGIPADANGAFTHIVVGGSGNGNGAGTGPSIQAYLNDEKFVDGSITNQDPILILHLADSLGINITGAGIGHDITAVLDNNVQNPFLLNNFYEADLNTFKRGTVRYPLPVLADGEHSLVIKAWDAGNNSGQATLSFRVVRSQHLTLDHVLNYPDPFTTHTSFWFEHNRPGEDLQVLIQIMTVSGKLVKSIRRTINDPGNRSNDIDWDGRDDYGAKIGRGVYIYRLRVRASDGSLVEKLEKLLIL